MVEEKKETLFFKRTKLGRERSQRIKALITIEGD